MMPVEIAIYGGIIVMVGVAGVLTMLVLCCEMYEKHQKKLT